LPPLDRPRTILAWSLYDWANSAFATVVMAGFFPIFFKQYWSEGSDPTLSTARLGLANSIAGIFVALIAPILGAIADKGSAKKRFLIFFAYMGVVMTAGLYTVAQGDWPRAVLLYVAATIGFSGANIFYDALLVGVASEKKMDWVSSLGFALGYLGGGLLFAFDVWMTLSPETFGFADAGQAVRFAFVTVAVWWALFSLPLILWVDEPKNSVPAAGALRAGWRQLRQTMAEIRHLKTIALFLAAYWLYMDGVDTIVRMAVDYGMSIGFATQDLITALLITQFVGFPAAIGFAYLGHRIGVRPAIFAGLAVYLVISIWAAFIDHKTEFYALAVLIGLVQGGVQALSRSFYARIIPPDKAAEYFGFYNMLGKFAVVIGPVLMGGTGLVMRHLGFTADQAARAGIAAVALLFVLGGALFYFVDEEKGRDEARYLTQNRKEKP
jgi:MFS transporter, UMF1 family